jgi:hypothetical protein
MSKRRGKTRAIWEILTGRVRPNIVLEGKNEVALEFPGRPERLLDIYTKGEHSSLLARANHHGIILWCKGCRNEHILPWRDYDRIKPLMRQEDAPPYFNILCIDGEHLKIGRPEERYKCARVICVERIIVDLTSNDNNDGQLTSRD